MQDLIYIVYAVAFFAISVGFVSFCERIIERDSRADRQASSEEPTP